MNREKAVRTFKANLLRDYNEHRDIRRSFYIYIGFLKEFAPIEYVEFVQWQMDDMLMSIYNEHIDPRFVTLETAWNYTRRGAKSRDCTIIATFFSLLDYDVIWRTFASDQLDQASKWFIMNPCVKKERIRHDNYVEIYDSPKINIGILSEAQTASRGADLLIFDELGMVEKHKKKYLFYKSARAMIKDSKFKHIINASTPAQFSAFHEIWTSLEELEVMYKTRFTSTHSYRDCHWISEEDIEIERFKNRDCPWFIQQNYEALWVNYGGNVFNNIIVEGDLSGPRNPDGTLKFYNGFLEDHYDKFGAANWGVDFNGEDAQHYRIGIDYNEKYVYVLKEVRFTNLWELDKLGRASIEVEDGLFNLQFTDQTKRMGLRLIYKPWNEAEKQIRVAQLCDRQIVINKVNCPTTWKNLMEAGYDKNSRLPKLAKRTDQHGLDGLLHAMHKTSGKIYVPRSIQNKHNKSPLLGGRRMYNPLNHL